MSRRGRPEPEDDDEDGASGPDSQRVDKWLWHARLAKTRALAVELVLGGKVRRNREKLSRAADQIRIGDVLTVTLSGRVALVRVIGFADRRGSPEDAARIAEAITPPA